MATRTGVQLIADERQRQVDVEGYGPESDRGRAGALMAAATCYTYQALAPGAFVYRIPEGWPWAAEFWKPADSAERNLVKAGALIAAAIDSLKAGV